MPCGYGRRVKPRHRCTALCVRQGRATALPHDGRYPHPAKCQAVPHLSSGVQSLPFAGQPHRRKHPVLTHWCKYPALKHRHPFQAVTYWHRSNAAPPRQADGRRVQAPVRWSHPASRTGARRAYAKNGPPSRHSMPIRGTCPDHHEGCYPCPQRSPGRLRRAIGYAMGGEAAGFTRYQQGIDNCDTGG